MFRENKHKYDYNWKRRTTVKADLTNYTSIAALVTWSVLVVGHYERLRQQNN